ncbi:MAG: hypothetical protein C5B54_04460 [Acidobacteria bacterium]|nr:MAG: hypothetical protein C5B54_04460 [Acidobacteriota bacterium]
MAFLLILFLIFSLPAISSAGDDAVSRDMMKAARAADFEALRTALELGADANWVGEESRPALVWAAQNGDVRSIRALMGAGASVDATDQNGDTAITTAAHFGRVEAVETLISTRADVNKQNRDGKTALMLSLAIKNVDIAKALLNARANPKIHDQNDDFALLIAARNNLAGLIQRLKLAGADVNDSNTQSSPLSAALEEHYGDCVNALLAAGANVNLKMKSGTTGLQDAIRNYDAEIFPRILGAKANLKSTDDQGLSPLMNAVLYKNLDAVAALIHAGADVNYRNPQTGQSVIEFASRTGTTEIVAILKNAGAVK